MGVRLYCVILLVLTWALLAHALGGFTDPLTKVTYAIAALRPEIIANLEAYTGSTCEQAVDSASVREPLPSFY
jgi:hypothetical protein